MATMQAPRAERRPPGSLCGPICRGCGHPLRRRHYEDTEKFARREFCNDSCAAKAGVLILGTGTQVCICGFVSDQKPCLLCQKEALSTADSSKDDPKDEAWDGYTYPSRRKNQIYDENALENYKILLYCLKYNKPAPVFDPDQIQIRFSRGEEKRKKPEPTWLDILLEQISE